MDVRWAVVGGSACCGAASKQRAMDLPWGAACTGGTLVAGVPLQEVWLSPAQEAAEAREDTARWQAQAVTQRVCFISLRSFAFFFFSLIHLPH